jgi:hypothetical protein
MTLRPCAQALALVSLICAACGAGSERHEVEATRTCLEERGLRVHRATENDPQLIVYHPRSGAYLATLLFYNDNFAARAAKQVPGGGLMTLSAQAVDNVLITGFWSNRREIRDCL